MLIANRIALTNRVDFIIVMAVASEIMAVTVLALGLCPRSQDCYSHNFLGTVP